MPEKLDPLVTDLEIFQAQHGRSWTQLVNSPEYIAAMIYVHNQALDELLQITDEEKNTLGGVRLARFQGFLQHENALTGLPLMKEFKFGDLGPEEYPDPISEAREEAASESQSESTATGILFEHIPGTHAPKPKRRGRPPGKRKRKK